MEDLDSTWDMQLLQNLEKEYMDEVDVLLMSNIMNYYKLVYQCQYTSNHSILRKQANIM